jgi:hypothetical protein
VKARDVVELKGPAEILATLDETGSLEGVPFMPEMLGYFGRALAVDARLDRVCDTIEPIGVREVPDAVVLDDQRCDGTAHAGCQAQCRLFWKEAWLRPRNDTQATEPNGTPTTEQTDGAYEELERLVRRNTQTSSSTAAEPIYRCQATELRRGSNPLPWRDVSSLLRQVTRRNVGVLRFVRVMSRVGVISTGQKLGVVSRYPFMPPNPTGTPPATTEVRGLEPGDRVRVRSKEEIAATLDAGCKNRGLWFDREMLAYCGRTARVKVKVERFVNERTGRLVELKSDCYILDGVICSSDRSDGRWFCPRGIYAWWRECWLERVDVAR